MLSSDEIKALIIALGVGIGEQYDPSKLRYHRIIIMTDADVDGAHIRTLLLTLFYRYFKELVEAGNIYIAQPPLFKIQRGKEIHYAHDEAEMDEIIEEMKQKYEASKKTKTGEGELAFEVKQIESEAPEGEEATEDEEADTQAETEAAGISIPGVKLQRYKGLGEMNPEQLWDTTMDPENRILLQVTVEDAEKADETFTVLMGDEVEPRKRFIQTHAANVKNLDV
jgi:DNA gyrase subunit B